MSDRTHLRPLSLQRRLDLALEALEARGNDLAACRAVLHDLKEDRGLTRPIFEVNVTDAHREFATVFVLRADDQDHARDLAREEVKLEFSEPGYPYTFHARMWSLEDTHVGLMARGTEFAPFTILLGGR